jgi:DNA-binding NarL/FixJ family response regulator
MALRILLADDHALFREGLRVLLTARGFDVICEVGTGVAAVEEAQRRSPDLVVLTWTCRTWADWRPLGETGMQPLHRAVHDTLRAHCVIRSARRFTAFSSIRSSRFPDQPTSRYQ